MKDTIFYFTGTGNSLAVAKKLAAQGEFELVPIASFRNHEKVKVDCGRVGFVFPLYFTELPLIVDAFIKKLAFEGKPYIFAVVTCGNPKMSRALNGVNAILRKMGQELSAGFTVAMADNYLPLYKVPGAEEQEALQKSMEVKAREISETLSKGEKKMDQGGPAIFHLFYLNFRRNVRVRDRHFAVSDACNGCATCEKVCPVDNIKMNNDRPVWLHNCEFCLACINQCPKTAIDWNGKTLDKGRLRNMDVTLKELMNQKA